MSDFGDASGIHEKLFHTTEQRRFSYIDLDFMHMFRYCVPALSEPAYIYLHMAELGFFVYLVMMIFSWFLQYRCSW